MDALEIYEDCHAPDVVVRRLHHEYKDFRNSAVYHMSKSLAQAVASSEACLPRGAKVVDHQPNINKRVNAKINIKTRKRARGIFFRGEVNMIKKGHRVPVNAMDADVPGRWIEVRDVPGAADEDGGPQKRHELRTLISKGKKRVAGLSPAYRAPIKKSALPEEFQELMIATVGQPASKPVRQDHHNHKHHELAGAALPQQPQLQVPVPAYLGNIGVAAPAAAEAADGDVDLDLEAALADLDQGMEVQAAAEQAGVLPRESLPGTVLGTDMEDIEWEQI